MELDRKACQHSYCMQVGGSGAYFQGASHKRGYGMLSNLIRYITPIAMKARKYLGKHLINTGSKVMSDVATGSFFKDSAKSRFLETSKKTKR
ncbi:uncharacterized protein NPIL_151571 [Nephila pilipes]|uniref:Uncharacterized protein n=1 Tax=Nephila pilipes TaxID=299642 RepID=A0A8X6P5M7_NEPPI|nr:uncharacterized protein NPIL_151571 [Nephila pilipes]